MSVLKQKNIVCGVFKIADRPYGFKAVMLQESVEDKKFLLLLPFLINKEQYKMEVESDNGEAFLKIWHPSLDSKAVYKIALQGSNYDINHLHGYLVGTDIELECTTFGSLYYFYIKNLPYKTTAYSKAV